jgi:hypothetical protein
MALPQLSLGRLTAARAAPWLDRAVPLGFGLALLILTPWRSAFQFGMDEGFELMKALLVSRGHPLYGDFWNDQPPLHTELLALLFRLFGPSAGVGRFLSVAFAVVLVAALYVLARRGSNRVAGLVAVGLLASASGFLELSVSVMLELPAFALGLAAVWAWSRSERGAKRGWLVLSGTLLACALQVKLTAALVLPALAADFLTGDRALRTRTEPLAAESRVREGWKVVWIWLGSAAGVFGLVTLLFYRPGAWAVFGAAHFSAATLAGAAQWKLVFDPATLLKEELALLAPAALGLGLLVWKRRRDLVFPAALLVTVLLVHWQHRPYWPYYRLHLAIPLAWLGAVGLAEGFRALWRVFPGVSRRAWLRFGSGWVACSLALATSVAFGVEKIGWELGRLRRAPRAQEESRVAALRARASGVRWVFTEDRLSAFWAGLPIPPELAVIPAKRLWSGQLTPAQAPQWLERYRPELIWLSEWRVKQLELANYLKARYRPDPSTPDLFLRR